MNLNNALTEFVFGASFFHQKQPTVYEATKNHFSLLENDSFRKIIYAVLFSVMRFFHNNFFPSALKIPTPQETDFGIVFAESSYSRTAQ